MCLSALGAARFIERLLADHGAIETSVSLLQRHVERGDFLLALVELAELHRLIVRHDGLDDNVLFPLLARDPALATRLALVRRQHRSSERLRGALEGALLDDNAGAAAHAASELHALVVGNHTTEEMVLYGCLLTGA